MTVIVRGELDVATAPELESRLVEAEQTGARSLVLDLSGLGFMDSTGLRVVLGAASRAEQREARFAVMPSRPVRRLLELTQTAVEIVELDR